MKMSTLRRIVLAVVAVVAVNGCAGSGPGGQSGSPTALRVAILPYSSAFPIWYANEEGLFKKNGLNIASLDSFSSGPEITAAFASGKYDLGYMGGPPAIAGGAAGVLQIIGVSNQQVHSAAVFARSGKVDVKDAAKAIGGKSALAVAGSNSQYILQGCLEHLGVDPKSVKVTNVAAANIPSTFKNGTGFIAAPWAPYSFDMESDASYTKLCDETTAGIGVYDLYVGSTGFLKDNRKAAVAFVKSIAQVQAQMEKDPRGMAPKVHKFLTSFGNTQSLQYTERDLGDARVFPDAQQMKDLFTSGKLKDALAKTSAFLVQTGSLRAASDLSFVNGNFVADALAG